MRELGQPGERGAPLEVDEDEVEVLGRVRRDQPEDDGPEELRFPASCGTDAQTVRSHALLRGLLEVQLDGRPVLVDPDRHPQALAQRPGSPRGRDVEGVRGAVHAEQFQQTRHPLRGVRAGAGSGRAAGSQAARGRLGLGRREDVRSSEPLDAATAACSETPRRRPVRADLQEQAAPLDEPAEGSGQVEDGDAGGSVGQAQVPGVGVTGVVEHHDDVRDHCGPGTLAPRPHPPGQLRGEPGLDGRQRRRHHPGRARAVAQAGVGGVREPLRPLPRRERGAPGDHGEQQVVGTVQGHQLGDDGAGEVADRAVRPAEPDRSERPATTPRWGGRPRRSGYGPGDAGQGW